MKSYFQQVLYYYYYYYYCRRVIVHVHDELKIKTVKIHTNIFLTSI